MGGCSANCQTQGIIECNGVAQAFANALADAEAWIKQHVTYSGSAEASCTGNTCQASAQGQAKASCAVSPAAGGGGLAIGLGVLAMAGIGLARRKRS